jgi:hypothetical protein
MKRWRQCACVAMVLCAAGCDKGSGEPGVSSQKETTKPKVEFSNKLETLPQPTTQAGPINPDKTGGAGVQPGSNPNGLAPSGKSVAKEGPIDPERTGAAGAKQ